MLHLKRYHLRRILEQAKGGLPLEICGLLAGSQSTSVDHCRITRVHEIYPVANEESDPAHYRMNPLQQLNVEKQICAQGIEIVGIYHSHPDGAAYPSRTDVDLAHWGDTDHLLFPSASYLIISLANPSQPDFRSFQIQGRQIPEDIREETVVLT